MHVVIAFASPPPVAGRDAILRDLALPHLQRLLAGRSPAWRDDGDVASLSPPHERALARAQGWSGGDGRLPLAAWQAQRDGLDTGDLAWGLMTPVHLRPGKDQVTLDDPHALALDQATSRELLDVLRPWFESEGFLLAWGAPLRWYLAHESLGDLATASTDRVVGRAVEGWLPPRSEARLLQRLHNEVQMLLYTHAINDRRESAGQLPVNSFWLSGCGRAQPARGVVEIHTGLRGPALAGDWAAWLKAWQTLDADLIGPLAERGQPWQLTLAGEQASVSFNGDGQARGLLGAWRARLARVDLPALLGTL